MNKRREFLHWGSRSFAAFLLGPRVMPALAASAPSPLFADPAELGVLGAPDENGLRLLPGFRSRVIARSGQPVLPGSGYLWHADPDGGACYAQDDGGWIYVSNCEVKVIEGGGGVGAVRFNAVGDIVAAYPILTGTDNNCA